MKTEHIMRSCALAIVLLLALWVFRPMEPVKAAGTVKWRLMETLLDRERRVDMSGLARTLQKMSDDGFQDVGDLGTTVLILKK
jgi:hypothetical protein